MTRQGADRGEGHQDDFQVVFRDLLMLLITGLVVLLGVTIMYMGAKASQAAQAPPVGNVVVDVQWHQGVDADVDLWVQGPGDSRPVGYSNRGGETMNLLRDDVGWNGDPGVLNYEDSVSRGVVPGRYVVNLHAYGPDSELVYPLEADVKVLCVAPKAGLREVLRRRVSLDQVGREVTVASFDLDNQCGLVPGSLSEDYVPLRGAWTDPGQPQEDER